jgi:ABC-type multidrug transport system fused ATPase/permease subunit
MKQRPARPADGGGGLRRQLPELLRPFRGRLLLAAAAVLTAAALDLVPPLVVRAVVDDQLTVGRTDDLLTLAALYLAAVSGVQLLTSGYGYLAATVAQRTLAVVRSRLFAHLLNLPAGYHDRTPVGDSISRCTADVEAIDDLFSSSAARLLGETTRLVTVAVAMLVLSPVLTAVAALVLPPLVLLTNVLRRRVRDAEREARVAVGTLNTQLQEDLSGVEVIRAFGRQDAFTDRFRIALIGWLRAVNRSTRTNAFYTPGVGLLSALATALLLWVGASGALTGAGVSVGTLTAFVLLFARFFAPLTALGEEWQKVQAALAGAERVFAVLALPADTTPPARVSPSSGSGGHLDRPTERHAVLDVQQVSFGYRDGEPVLREVTVQVHAGEHVAIVGRTGSGKSTLLTLLAGLYAPHAGRLQVAGHDPRALAEADRRLALGFVPQAVQLFTGTVHDNLTLCDQRFDREQVRSAAVLAGADGFLRALPDGYDTVLSDSARGAGVQLSAGQRQLLALARALVGTPTALLLDEATAAIDGASEAAFRAALRHRVQATGTAVLTVAHKLATAREADHVVVLDCGRIVEQGPPAQLLAANRRFAALAALDAAGWDWEHDAALP